MRHLRFFLILLTLGLQTYTFCQLAKSPWPKFHGNNFNTGLSANGGSNGLLRWSYPTGGQTNSSPAIGPDGTIYVGSYASKLFAVNPDGTTKWTFATDSWLNCSPTIGLDGTIYFGSWNGTFYAVGSDGKLKWKALVGDFVEWPTGAAIGPDGTIYVCTSPGGPPPTLCAFKPDGTLKWSLTKENGFLSSFMTCVAVGSDGTIYAINCAGESQGGGLYALNPDGATKWYFPCADGYAAPSLGLDGTIYLVGYITDQDAHLSLIAVSGDGKEKWAVPTTLGNAYGQTPAIGPDGTIYVSGVYDLTAYNQAGKQLWNVSAAALDGQAGYWFFSDISVGADGTIYASTYNGTGGSGPFYAFNPSGGVKWSCGDVGSVLGGPAIAADGTIYVGSVDGNLYAIGTEVNTVPVASLTDKPTSVTNGASSAGTVTLAQAAPAGGDVVTLKSGSLSAVVPPFVTVPGGSTTARFEIRTRQVAATTVATITAASGGKAVTATLTVTPPPGLAGVSVSPTTVVGGTSSTGTVVIKAPSPTGGTAITLASNSSSATVPGSVAVPAGSTSATFTVSTKAVSSSVTATIQAALGSATASATLTVSPAPVSSVVLNPTSVNDGSTATGTVTLGGPAGPSGDVVSLASNNADATVGKTVTVAAGKTAANFTIATHGLLTSNGSATITATFAGTQQSATLSISAAGLVSVALSPTSVQGGTSSTGTVTLAKAVNAAVVVALSSSSSAATVPSSVTIPAGATSATLTVRTSAVSMQTVATITAKSGKSVAAKLTVTPATISSLSLSPTYILDGSSSIGTVTLNGPAGPGGDVVTLASASTDTSLPTTVTVPAGKTSVQFTIKTLGKLQKSTTATITAVFGSSSASSVLSIGWNFT